MQGAEIVEPYRRANHLPGLAMKMIGIPGVSTITASHLVAVRTLLPPLRTEIEGDIAVR